MNLGFAELSYTFDEDDVNATVCVNLINSTIINPTTNVLVNLSSTQGTATGTYNPFLHIIIIDMITLILTYNDIVLVFGIISTLLLTHSQLLKITFHLLLP